MPEFKNKEEYEKWKAERVIELKKKQEKPLLRQAQDDSEKTISTDSKESIESPVTKVVAPTKAHIKKKSEFAGMGCLLQALGILIFLASFILLPIGPLFGFLILLVLLIYGSRISMKLICSQCGNPVDNKKVKLCPACRVEFE